MNQGAVNAEMLPWTDGEFTRFTFRQALFMRRGWSERKADAGADRLALRDQLGDDRRVCIECANQTRPGLCTQRLPVIDVLQRCPQFRYETPT